MYSFDGEGEEVDRDIVVELKEAGQWGGIEAAKEAEAEVAEVERGGGGEGGGGEEEGGGEGKGKGGGEGNGGEETNASHSSLNMRTLSASS